MGGLTARWSLYPFRVIMQAFSQALGRVRPAERNAVVDWPMLGYVTLLATAAIGLFWVTIAIYGVGSSAYAVCALALVAAVAERWSARLGENLEASVSLVAMVFAAVLLGPVESLLVAAASTAG